MLSLWEFPQIFQFSSGTLLHGEPVEPLNFDDYRSILLASHLAKLVLHQFLIPIKPVYNAMIPVVQMGAVSKHGTDFATCMLTSFIESRTNNNDSIGMFIAALVKNLHDGCWLAYDDLSTIALCSKGVRQQGWARGPMFVNTIYQLSTGAVKDKLRDEGRVMSLPASSG